MRIIGLLNWYQESTGWLAECVSSAAKLCDHIIAVDGAYAEFPGSTRTPASTTDQAEAILGAAAGAGIGCTIHAPRQVWWGGELEKRDFMFILGMTFAQEDDWFLRIDADEVLTDVPSDTRERLESTEQDVAEVLIVENVQRGARGRNVGRGVYQNPFRCLFRAIPGIRIEQAHFVVTVPGPPKRVLMGNEQVHHLEPAEPLWDVRLLHRTQQRDEDRWDLKRQYYDRLPEIEHVQPLA